jgi:hypothetical protein
MRCRRYFPIVLLATAAACAGTVDDPTAPSLAKFTESSYYGDPPPPPVDTQATMSYQEQSASAPARFMLNKPGTMAWVDFQSGGTLEASPNARLQYNQKSGRTNGTGQLTFPDGTVLDLKRVEIIAPEGGLAFERCDAASSPEVGDRCVFSSIAFTVDGGSGGTLHLTGRRSTAE